MITQTPPQTDRDRKLRYQRLDAQLRNNRSTWEAPWRDLADHFSPYAYQLDQTTQNQGGRRDAEVLDPQGILSLRAAVSGLMASLTTPTKRWAELAPRNPEIAESKAVQDWCEEATERLEARLRRSNLYTVLPLLYEDALAFGTGAATFLELPTDVLFEFGHLQMGTYSLARSGSNLVNTMSRNYRMTAEQMVEMFGLENVSDVVRLAIKNQQGQEWFNVSHIIAPNELWDKQRPLSKYKQFASCYFEPGLQNPDQALNGKFLSEEGFDEFPLIVGRWKVRGSDTYGRGPAIDVLGACRALQAYQYKIALAVDKELDPSMIAPAGMDLNNISLLPGSINQAPDNMGGQLAPTHQVRFNIADALLQVQDLRGQIRRGLFEDLFLMIANAHGDMTAREIIERQEEKIQQLGPVILNLSHETLDPLISRAVAIMFRRGEMPEIPPELQGQPLKVEYVSSLAQAQQLVDAQAIVETTQFALSLAPGQPMPRTIDTDKAIREYSRMRRASPKIVRSDEEVAAMDQAEQAQMQEQARQQQAAQAANTAMQLSKADTSGKNALTDTANALESQGGIQ